MLSIKRQPNLSLEATGDTIVSVPDYESNWKLIKEIIGNIYASVPIFCGNLRSWSIGNKGRTAPIKPIV
jgi:hypothetical protein